MKKSLNLTVFSIVFFLVSFSTLASGRPPQDLVSENFGYACTTPKKGSGVVAGYFRGWEQTPFQSRGSGMMPVERYRCFSTVKDCNLWLRTMTYWYNNKTIDSRMCNKF